jgi:hypothetical protein
LQKAELIDARSFCLRSIDLRSLDVLRGFFDNLPLDPYLAEPYRSRRFSQFRVAPERLELLGHRFFVQAKEYNRLLGDVRRYYAELDEELTAVEDFRRIVFDFVETCHIPTREADVDVHQIKVISAVRPGCPAPEGVHRDGFDYIGICCVSRDNIDGGETTLYEPGGSEPIYRKTLEPGELLVVNDRRLLHYTSPIEAADARGGARSVFILTATEAERRDVQQAWKR